MSKASHLRDLWFRRTEQESTTQYQNVYMVRRAILSNTSMEGANNLFPLACALRNCAVSNRYMGVRVGLTLNRLLLAVFRSTVSQ